ncbi:MAG: DUF169 domain-containing protein [Promethearchaeota archaeon]
MVFINLLTIKEIGMKLNQAGRLSNIPLCIYGTDEIPGNAELVNKIDRCLAKAIFSLSINKSMNAIYISEDNLIGICPGGQAWLGYKPFLPMLKYFLSTGIKSFRKGAAEFLLSSPELAEKQLKMIGNLEPLGKFTVIQKYDTIENDKIDVKSFLCFGNAEQIRNLCSLAYFNPEDSFTIQVPWGASCASFITYSARISQKYSENTIIIGPTDPTGNYWFPENFLSIGIPFKIAERMALDLEKSFIKKRPTVAYPSKRTLILR